MDFSAEQKAAMAAQSQVALKDLAAQAVAQQEREDAQRARDRAARTRPARDRELLRKFRRKGPPPRRIEHQAAERRWRQNILREIRAVLSELRPDWGKNRLHREAKPLIDPVEQQLMAGAETVADALLEVWA